MNRSISVRSTIIFVALTTAGVVMAALVAPALGATNEGRALSDIGAAVVAGALAFFLVDALSRERRRNA